MYDASNLSPPDSCSPLNNETPLKQSTALTNLLTNHHLNNTLNPQTTSDLLKSSVHFNMSTTTLSPSSNSSCSAAAISPSTYNAYNTYLPTFSSSTAIDRSNNYLANENGDHLTNSAAAAAANHSQYLENYQSSLINHHNSPSLSSSPSSVSSTPFTSTNLHNHFAAAHSTGSTTSAHPLSGLNGHSSLTASAHHSNLSNSTTGNHLTAAHQTELTNHHSSLSNSLSNSSVMHHLNNQNSSFSFNHPHQPNHQLNLSSFNHLHADTTDLANSTAAFRNSSSTAGTLSAQNNPMSFYINNTIPNGDSMLNNPNHSLTSLTNWNPTNIDYFSSKMDTFVNSNKFNKLDRGESTQQIFCSFVCT